MIISDRVGADLFYPLVETRGSGSITVKFHYIRPTGSCNVDTVEPRLTTTSVIRSLRYFGHFFWPPGKTTINLLVKKPSLIWSPRY